MVNSPSNVINIRTPLLSVFLWVGVVLLPFDFLPLRFEGHETHRTGLTLVLAIGMLAVLLSKLKLGLLLPNSKLEKLFLVAVACFVLSLILSTVFALSPTLALTGDLIRRMGLLTQLALVVIAFAAREVDWRLLARGFWFAGVICAVYTLLQLIGWIPNPIEGRAFGTLGAPTFTASWLVSSLLYSSVWTLSDKRHSKMRTARFAGLLLMVAGLLATGGRGALLALAVSVVVGGLAFAWVTHRRAMLFAIIGLVAIAGLGVFGLSRIDWQTSPLANWPLISRLNPTLPDTPRAVREQVWQNAVDIFVTPPLFTSIDGQPDRFHTLRRWFGYGQDHFEIVHRPYVDDNLLAMEQGRPIDRAHNVIFDLLVMHGAVGLVAWLAVWSLAVVIALRRLYQARQSGADFWLPLLVLTIIVAHAVDLLFSFETIAGVIGVWLALGLVLQRDQPTVEAMPVVEIVPSDRWLLLSTIGIAMLIGRGLSPLSSDEATPVPAMLVLCAVIVLSALVVQSTSWRSILAHAATTVIFMVLGLLLGQIHSADGAALIEILMEGGLIGALILSSGLRFEKRRRVPIAVPTAAVMLISSAYWFNETRAQINFSQGIAPGMLSASTEEQAVYHRQAALDFPLDAKLQRYAAIALYQAAVNRIDGADVTLLTEAQQFAEASVRLNAYDANALLTLSDIEYTFAGLDDNPQETTHFQRAIQLETAAGHLLQPSPRE